MNFIGKVWIVSSVATLAFLASVTTACASTGPWNGKAFRARSGEEVSQIDLIDSIKHERQIVLGEKHLTPAVQRAQAGLMASVVQGAGEEGNFDLAWEFLNYSDRKKIQVYFDQYLHGEIDAEGFLKAALGSDSYTSYAPLIRVLKQLGGRIVPTNLTRAEKAPVVQGGIDAADPSLVPPGFEMGGDAYYERFAVAMGEHTPPEKLKNYFAAQCLTDDVMAYHFTQLPFGRTRFLVAGSFHTDFFDGVVNRIRARLSSHGVAVVRFMDASDFTKDELDHELRTLLRDPKYGPVADYVIFVNEPRAAGAPVPEEIHPMALEFPAQAVEVGE